ncbi:beta-galactosidase [Spirochaetia bacterium]|nr:beta-galactosidase [Spirochaetia bacterium]
MTRLMQQEQIPLGICYYPEHWSRDLWQDDLRRMKDAGISIIRIGDYAWSIHERNEGVFTFDLFDDFLALAHAEGMNIIFVTPTASPPGWLAEKYPEICNVRKDGVQFKHGNRRNYNYNSPVYLRFVANLVEHLSSHFAGHPAVIGWQIDNELNCQTDEFYSESDTLAFRTFLQQKYVTVDALNEAWGTVVWNQTYNSWKEVFVPRIHVSPAPNPHLVMDYIRFVSDSACKYVKLQSGILRKYIKEGDFITTNGMYASLDHCRLVKESLDFYTIVNYPNGVFTINSDTKNSGELNDRAASRTLTELRAASLEFGIMEQQGGAGGWNIDMPTPQPKPGQLALWTMASIAHGADYIGFFRWRTCNRGTEIYWHGILDYSNRDNRRLAELNGIGKKMKALSEVKHSRYKAAFGVIKDYDNIWDAQVDNWHKVLSDESEAGIFKAAQLTHTPMDYVYLTDSDQSVSDLSNYPLLFYPHPTIITEKRTALLSAYVEAGGTLIIGCRAGYKNTNGHCLMTKLPGLFSEITGTDISDSSFISPDDDDVLVDWDGKTFKAPLYTDILEPVSGGKAIAVYTNNYYAGSAALVQKASGKGKACYFGSVFSTEIAALFLEKFGISKPWGHLIEAPEVCEIAVREKDGKNFLFVMNYGKAAVPVKLNKEMTNLFTGQKESGALELGPYETVVLSFTA